MSALEEFPVISLTPKRETGVISFLTKYPEYDGRGTTIAIIDSGVDPGAPGLKVTSDGKRKIIHRFDCSGCGDVSTTTVVQPVDGIITGLTGRKLKIPDEWNNPTNDYRIGSISAFNLYPEKLVKEMKQQYKEKNWDDLHREILTYSKRELSHIEPIGDLADKDKMRKEDLEATVDMLTQLDKKIYDDGPVYDCILFQDGEMWRCCVDSTEKGDLKDCPLLGEFSKTGDYAPLTRECNLNITMNVHDEGDTLELVGLCSTHGTLVAAIAAAYFPDSPAENGVAPGAQIISLTIGDCRLGSMETGTALVRAMIKIMELSKTQDVHVINMSYGEHSHWSDTGRLGELMKEVVDKYGIPWVVSAGNHGPALSTVGSPPDMSEEIFIGVGAYVSPEMMQAEYSMRQKLPGTLYTWSSRGPTMDGAMGVTVCAPGGAITSLPNFTLAYSSLCNGTSMSAPHTAGAVSLLISGLLKRELPYSPYSIKRAIEASATYVNNVEVFVQGSGLLNVEKTFDHLVANHAAKELNVRFKITCGSRHEKGIYRRNKLDVSSFLEQVSIQPYFLNSDKVPKDIKINFNLRLALTCDATFVSSPTHLDVSNLPRIITVKVDTKGLDPGVYSTFIKAYDLSNIEKGALFKIPITVIIPQVLQNPMYYLLHNDVMFESNTIKRHYIHVPENATLLTLHLSTKDEDSGKFIIHALQILPGKSCKTIDSFFTTTINAQNDESFAFQVKGGLTVEIVIAKFWSDIGSMKLDYSFKFRGIKPNQPKVTMLAANGICCLELATLQGEDITPSLVLNTSTLVVRPSEAKISALTSRDVIPKSRQIYELLLVYNFNISKATEITPNLAPLSDLLYESEFESQIWMLYDTNKRLICCGDAYPSKYSKKIEKGDYVLRAQVRHEKMEHLEKLSEVAILIQQKLSSPITVDIYSSYSNALVANKKAMTHSSTGSVVVNIYIAPLPSEKLAKVTGQYLSGTITYMKDEICKKADTYSFEYIPVDGTNKKNSNGNNISTAKNKLEELNEQIRDMKIQMIPKLDLPSAQKVFEELCADESTKSCVSLYSAYLSVLDPLDPTTALPPFSETEPEDRIDENHINKVITICDKIIDLVDSNALLINSAVKTDAKADTAKNKRSENQKSALIDALCHKGIVMCRSQLKATDKSSKLAVGISEVWRSLGRFVDLGETTLKSLSSSNVLYFIVWYSYTNECYGKCFKYLWRLQEDQKNLLIEEKLIDLSRLNDWPHVEGHLKRLLPSKFCNKYRPF